MKFACVFPGQGSQAIGMLGELAAAEPRVAETFAEASEALGYDLWQLCSNGPESELNATDRTQPALLAAGVAVWRVWRDHGGADPEMMAGHSLGEYAALVCSGALDFAAAVRLVETRGRLMQEAVPLGLGSMAAILGLDDDAVQDACAEAAGEEVVSAVNFNAPGQVVIAGHAAAVERAIAAAKSRGAKRAMPLPVSVPSHCALMAPAAEKLAKRLADTPIRRPGIPVVLNVSARPASDPESIRDALTRQLHSPVRWVESMRYAAQQGVGAVVEMGPGKVLTGLVKRIDPALIGIAVNDPGSLAQALTQTGDQA